MDITEYDGLLIKINDRLYLSKNDPEFLRKYALYFPTDGAGLLKYAEQLEAEGQHQKATLYYTKAAEQGVRIADNPLNAKKRKAMALMTARKKASSERFERTDKRLKRALKLSIFLLLLLLLLLLLKTCSLDTVYPAPAPDEPPLVYYDEVVPTPPEEVFPTSTEETASRSVERKQTYTADELRYLVAYNTLHRFKEERGEFPNTLSALTKDNPENWISSVSGDFSYATDGHTFSLRLNSVEEQLATMETTPSSPSSLFELHFYPATNQLALVSGDTPLVLYSVASGKEPLPFAESKVVNRVVEPNGKDSALGSRGLALADNYAIHGTDEPTSIGEYVTAGCLRLANADIDSLYSYVSKGTPFRVITDDTPGVPMFELGLPPLQESKFSFHKETTPNQQYHWKN